MTTRTELKQVLLEIKAKLKGGVINWVLSRKTTGLDGLAKRLLLKSKDSENGQVNNSSRSN